MKNFAFIMLMFTGLVFAEEFRTTGPDFHFVQESGVIMNGQSENGLLIVRWRHPITPVVDGVDQIFKTEIRIMRENLGQDPEIINEWLFDVNQTFYGHESQEWMVRVNEYEGFYSYLIETTTIHGDVYITEPGGEYNRFLVLPEGERYGDFNAGRISTRGSFETTLTIGGHKYRSQEINAVVYPDGGGFPITLDRPLFVPEGLNSVQFNLSEYFGTVSGSLVLWSSNSYQYIDAVSAITSHLSPNATLQRAAPLDREPSTYFVNGNDGFDGELDGYWVQITNTDFIQSDVKVFVNGSEVGKIRVSGETTSLTHLTATPTHVGTPWPELVALDSVTSSGALTFEAQEGVAITVLTLRGGEIVAHPGR